MLYTHKRNPRLLEWEVVLIKLLCKLRNVLPLLLKLGDWIHC